jgi:hypothetical protein
MKTIFLFVAVVAASLTVKAQGNLQFNQVLNMSNGTNYSVPEGKVLKIESINFNSPSITSDFVSCGLTSPAMGVNSGVNCSYQGINYLVIGSNVFTGGGGDIYINYGGACSVCPPVKIVNLSATQFNYPIWLSNGQIVSVSAPGIFVSAIEFNIVP